MDYTLSNALNSETTLRYTDDISYFGAGTLAITALMHNSESGAIQSADILINQSNSNYVELTLDKSKSSFRQAYLGDILSHEFGHFFGLSHSEVIHSTMIFSIFKNQHTIHSDDIAGIKKLYNMNAKQGSLRGRVVATTELEGVFSAHVQVISTATNNVVQSQLTSEKGEFFIENLDTEDSYYILISPVRNKNSLSDYYKNINNKHCGETNFKASFYTKCGPRAKSRPQVFKLTSEQDYIDVGDMTIRCSENIDTEYYSNKNKTIDRTFPLVDGGNVEPVVFNGVFSDSEITDGALGLGDEYSLDYRSHSDTANMYLKVDLTAAGIGSDYAFEVHSKKVPAGSWNKHYPVSDMTGKKLVDMSIRLELSDTASENLFHLKVFPVSISTPERYEIFSTLNLLNNSNKIYSLQASIGRDIAGVFEPVGINDSYPYDDNQTCSEGVQRYESKPYVEIVENPTVAGESNHRSGSSSSNTGLFGISCGLMSVDSDDDSNSSGGNSFFIGALLIFLLINIFKIDLNSLSKS